MKNSRKSWFIAVVVLCAMILSLATAAYAPAAALPPCWNGVQDGNETGIDCGESCFNKYILEVCDGKDNDKNCLVDDACKTNTGEIGSGTPSGSGGSGASVNPTPGYQKFTIPQPNASSSDGNGSTSSSAQAEVQPSQMAPGPEPLKFISQDSASDGSQTVPEEVPGEISQKVGATGDVKSTLSASSSEQGASGSPSGNEKADNVEVKSEPNQESKPNSQVKPNALVRIARFFRGLFR